MLPAILATFLSLLSSSVNSIFSFFSTFLLGAFSDVSDFVSCDKIVNLLVITLSENQDTGRQYSPSAMCSAPATGLSKNPGPLIGPSTHSLSSPSLPLSALSPPQS